MKINWLVTIWIVLIISGGCSERESGTKEPSKESGSTKSKNEPSKESGLTKSKREPTKESGLSKSKKKPGEDLGTKKQNLLQNLEKASSFDFEKIIKEAINNNADLAASGEHGKNVLHFLLSSYLYTPEASLIEEIAHKGGPKVINAVWDYLGSKKTPLLLLKERNLLSYDFLKALIDNGADLKKANFLLPEILQSNEKNKDKSIALILKKDPDLLDVDYDNNTPLNLLLDEKYYYSNSTLTNKIYNELVKQNDQEALDKIQYELKNSAAFNKLKNSPEFSATAPDYEAMLPDGTKYNLFKNKLEKKQLFDAFKEFEKVKPDNNKIEPVVEHFVEKVSQLIKYFDDAKIQALTSKSSTKTTLPTKTSVAPSTKPTTIPITTPPIPTKQPTTPPTTTVAFNLDSFPPGCKPEIAAKDPQLEQEWNQGQGDIDKSNLSVYIAYSNDLRTRLIKVWGNYIQDNTPRISTYASYPLLDHQDATDYNSALDKNYQHLLSIKKKCIDLLFDKESTEDKKVLTHFGLPTLPLTPQDPNKLVHVKVPPPKKPLLKPFDVVIGPLPAECKVPEITAGYPDLEMDWKALDRAIIDDGNKLNAMKAVHEVFNKGYSDIVSKLSHLAFKPTADIQLIDSCNKAMKILIDQKHQRAKNYFGIK